MLALPHRVIRRRRSCQGLVHIVVPKQLTLRSVSSRVLSNDPMLSVLLRSRAAHIGTLKTSPDMNIPSIFVVNRNDNGLFSSRLALTSTPQCYSSKSFKLESVALESSNMRLMCSRWSMCFRLSTGLPYCFIEPKGPGQRGLVVRTNGGYFD